MLKRRVRDLLDEPDRRAAVVEQLRSQVAEQNLMSHRLQQLQQLDIH